MKTDTYWECEFLEPCEQPSSSLLENLMRGYVPAVVIPAVLSEEFCREVTDRTNSLRATNYDGIDLAWALPEDKQGPGHWEIKFGNRSWLENLAAAPKIDKAIAELFAGISHPRDVIVSALSAWPHGSVGTLVHPLFGQPVIAGQLRRGAPDAHVDDFNLDATLASTHGQLGCNLILNNPEDGDLEIFNTLWNRPGFRIDSGRTPVGNYGIPEDEFIHAPSVRVPCAVGSLILVSNRMIHRVTPVRRPLERLAYALHGAWMFDGSLRLFS